MPGQRPPPVGRNRAASQLPSAIPMTTSLSVTAPAAMAGTEATVPSDGETATRQRVIPGLLERQCLVIHDRAPPFGIMSDTIGAAKAPIPHRLYGDWARRRPDGLVFQLRPADRARDHQQVNQRPHDRHAGANQERQHE
jgi:hypothetical protein